MQLNINQSYDINDVSKMFYDMLNEDSDDDINNICCITHESLNSNYIKLECNHTFNYMPIYNEIINQKKMISNYNTIRLRVNQIQCPYCRNIQNRLLPLRGDVDKIYGVNYPDRYTMKLNKCKYVYKSGKNKNTICNNSCDMSYCNKHKKYANNLISNNVNTNCSVILKSGKNKGCNCNLKVFEDGMCKRHYNLSKKLSNLK
jgi:sarcosine oxidase delta subunit